MNDMSRSGFPDVSAAFEKERQAPRSSSVVIDYDRYQEILDDPNMSSDQQQQIILALWSILTAFVHLGYEVHPVQQACGQSDSKLDLERKTDSTEVELQLDN